MYLCGRERPGVRLAPDSSHGVCVVCGPILQKTSQSIRTSISWTQRILRAPRAFRPSLIDTCRITLWPTLLAHLERDEPNRGTHRHYWRCRSPRPAFAPDFFFDDAILRIVRRAMDDRVVADQWGYDVPVGGIGPRTSMSTTRETAVRRSAGDPAAAVHARRQLRAFTNGASRRTDEIAPGTHRMPRAAALRAVEAGTIPLRPVELDVGDVLIRHPWALHRGSPNTTPTPRALLSIRYVRRWYADDSREVNSIPRAVWNSLTDAQQRIMRFPVAEDW